MPRKSLLPQSSHHVMIFDEDWEFLQQLYGPRGLKPLGVSQVIQTIVHRKVNELRARYHAELDHQTPTDSSSNQVEKEMEE